MGVWKRLPNWTYELFDRDTAPETLGVFAPIVQLWTDKRGTRPMPSWSDFDFQDFKGWHGRIVLQEVVQAPFDLRCRLWGSRVTEILGTDNTGKLYSEIGPSYTETDLAYLAEVCGTASIGRSHGTLDWLEKDYQSVAFIDLPLSGDGTAANHVLSALIETTVA